MCNSTKKGLWDNMNKMYSDLRNRSKAFKLTLKSGKIQPGIDIITK